MALDGVLYRLCADLIHDRNIGDFLWSIAFSFPDDAMGRDVCVMVGFAVSRGLAADARPGIGVDPTPASA
jgi:hypothetical protein